MSKHPDTTFSELTPGSQNRLMETVSLVVAWASTLLTPLLYLTSDNLFEPAAGLLSAVLGWVIHWHVRRGLRERTALLLNASVLVVAVAAVLAHGSVRNGANFLFVGVVVGAGILFSRRILVIITAIVLTLLALLTLAENHGLLRTPDQHVGLKTWVIQAVCLVVVAMLVFRNRLHIGESNRRLREELDLRLQTEEERDRNLDRFARIFHNNPSPMVTQSARDGMILNVNPAFERCYGYARSQVVGQLDSMLWAVPEQRDLYLRELNTRRRTDRVAALSRRADGSTFDVLVSSELSDRPGDRLVITSIIDVSKEREHEALLTSLASGVVGETGENLLHRLCQHMATSLKADMAVVAERRNHSWMQTLAVQRDGHAALNHAYRLTGSPCEKTLAEQGPCVLMSDVDLQFPGLHWLSDKGYRTYVGQRLVDADGHAIGLIHALWKHPVELDTPSRALLAIYASRANAELMRIRRDREIERLNATLDLRVRERTAELQKLNAELDSFAYSVSHDLKSPLRAIDGFTHLLQESMEGRMDAHERDIFQRILAATHRMSKLIADLLALARVSQVEFHRHPVDLGAMALEILQAEQQRAPQRPLRWRIGSNLHAQADPHLIRIALENLLSNAVKYTRDQAQPLIEFDREEADGQAAEFVLRDNGAGFDMAHADKLFKPFQRLHMPSSGYRGTGIGLATVRRIVERHGGAIRGSASPQAGAEFRFTLTGPDNPTPVPAGPETHDH